MKPPTIGIRVLLVMLSFELGILFYIMWLSRQMIIVQYAEYDPFATIIADFRREISELEHDD